MGVNVAAKNYSLSGEKMFTNCVEYENLWRYFSLEK